MSTNEEKPEPCFYCGSECHVESTVGLANVTCDDDSCCYQSREFNTRDEAIAAHNRVARAVRAAKGSEAK